MNQVIAPGGFLGLEIKKDQKLRLHQTEGQQVADILSYNLDTPGERMSMYSSASANEAWRITTGHTLVGTRGNVLWTIEADTVGENYLGGGFCNPYSNMRRFGSPGPRTCLANLNEAGAPYSLTVTEYEGDMCFNAFMRVEYNSDLSKRTMTPSSQSGDEMVMRSHANQIVLISNCPQTRGKTNAGKTHTLGVEVL